MNCEQVKTVLADYLDGAVTGDERAMVDAHLKGCAACREDLGFLKKYKKAIGKFPTLQAPDDFLEKVHRGIDAQKRGGIVRTLFFPLRVKVPLEAAALLALALTGVLIFKPYQTTMLEYAAEQDAAITDQKAGADRSGERDIALEKKYPSAEKKDDTIAGTRREARPAPEQEGVAVTSSSQPGGPQKEKQAAADETTEITLSLRLNAVEEEKAAPEDLFIQEKSDSTGEARIQSSRNSLRSSAAPTASRARKTERSTPDRSGISTIDSLARSLGGKIIKKVMDDKTGAARFVAIELPAENFNQFIGGLSAQWSVLGQVPAEPPRGSGTVRIKMHIQD